MAVKTQPIPVITASYKDDIAPITLIVDTQEIADSFNNTFLDWTRRSLTFGGHIINGIQVPTGEINGKALTLRVGVNWKSHRNTKWDDPKNGIYDYRSCAFGKGNNPPYPHYNIASESIPMQTSLDVDLYDEPNLVQPDHQLIQIAKGIINANNFVILKELNETFNDDGSKITTIIIYSKK
jgi:hypothetical protein